MKRWLLAMAVLAALFVGASRAQAQWGCRPYRPYGFSYGYYRPFAYRTYVYRPVYPYRSFVSGTPWFGYSYYYYYSPGFSFGWSYGW